VDATTGAARFAEVIRRELRSEAGAFLTARFANAHIHDVVPGASRVVLDGP
jgi:hypothetical protein